MNTFRGQSFGPGSCSGIGLPVGGETILREATGGKPGEVRATVFVGTRVLIDCKAHEWNLVTAIESFGEQGDHCAAYDKADRYGGANIWGRCIEVQDTTGRGALWGLEVDVLTHPDGKRGDRWGVGLVVGKHHRASGPAYLDRGFAVLPWQFDYSSVRVGTVFDASTIDCDAALAMRSGARVYLDTGREVAIAFDAETGFVELLFRGKPAAQFQVETHELRIGGRTVTLP